MLWIASPIAESNSVAAWITTMPGSALQSNGSTVCMIGGSGNLPANMARTKSMPAIDATTSGGVTPYSEVAAVRSSMAGSGAFMMMTIIPNDARWCQRFRHCERKRSNPESRARKAGLLRRGACHRARIRATRWLLAMTDARLRPLVRAHQVGEPLEQIMRIARAGRGLGVILDGKHRFAVELDAAIGAIEQRHMGLGRALRQGCLIHRKAVVHRGDLHLAGGLVLDRMIGAVMALMHLPGLGADGKPQHLMPQADPKGGRAGCDHLLDHRHRIFAGFGRIAGAVRKKHAVGLHRQNIFGRRRRRHHRDLAARAGEQAQDVALDAIVDSDDVELRFGLPAKALVPRPWRLVPGEALARRHHRHQVHALQARPFARFFL